MPNQGTKEYYIELFNSSIGSLKTGTPEGEGQGSYDSPDLNFSLQQARLRAKNNFTNQFPGDAKITELETISTVKEETYQLNNGRYFTINRSKFKAIIEKSTPPTGSSQPTKSTSTTTFKSTIVDKNTLEPIVGATVDDGKGNTVKTDENGEFEIEISNFSTTESTSEQTYSLISRGDGMRGNLTIEEPYQHDDGTEFIGLTAVLYNFPEEFKESRSDFINFEGYTFGSEFENNGNILEISNFFLQNELNPDLKIYGLKGDIEINNREVVEAEVINIESNTILPELEVQATGIPSVPTLPATTISEYGSTPELQTLPEKETVESEVIDMSMAEIKEANLIVTSPNHAESSVIPYTQNGNVRDTLGIIPLTSNEEEKMKQQREELLLTEPQIKSLSLSKTTVETRIQIALNKVITQLKTVLLPQIITLIFQFGISKIMDALKKKFKDINATCPANLEELNRLIAKKNKLTKALNNIYNFLKKIKVGVDIVDKTLTVAEIALNVAQAITFIPITPVTPLPTATATVVEKIRRELKKYKIISSTTLLVLTILIQILQKILQYLALLDELIQGCTEEYIQANPGSEVEIQTQIDNDLLLATQQQEEQGSPIITNVNGFEMGVESVDNVTVGGLKRRRAIAKNKAGVIMLKGEASFSSNDQILIDELVFYIQQNDLKAD